MQVFQENWRKRHILFRDFAFPVILLGNKDYANFLNVFWWQFYDFLFCPASSKSDSRVEFLMGITLTRDLYKTYTEPGKPLFQSTTFRGTWYFSMLFKVLAARSPMQILMICNICCLFQKKKKRNKTKTKLMEKKVSWLNQRPLHWSGTCGTLN